MKKTFYILYNQSLSVGQYLLDDEYNYLNPECNVTLDRKPTNWTQNIVVSMYRKEVPDEIKKPEPVVENEVEKTSSNKKKKKGE